MRIGDDTAHIDVVDHGSCVEIGNLEIGKDAPKSAAIRLMSEAVKMAGGRDIYITCDVLNHEAAQFYIRKGFEITHVVMRRKA